MPRASFFKSKPSQSGRAARKETLADWQQAIDIIDAPVAVSIARRKQLGQAHGQISGQHRLAQSIELVVGMIVCKKAAKGSVAAERTGRDTVIRRQVLAAGSIDLVVAADFART